MHKIYRSDYSDTDEGDFNSELDAIEYALKVLPSDDFVFLVGTDEGIDAIVFQGAAYIPEWRVIQADADRTLLEACKAALNWRGLDGDGIGDPVRQQLIKAVTGAVV
jgi:hypothetical protein